VTNPYAADLAGRDPIAALEEARAEIRRLTAEFEEPDWARSYGPGKWTAAELALHLAQVEMVFGVRARFALSTGAYVAQPFDQVPFMAVEGPLVEGPVALASFLAQRAMNLQLYRRLTPQQLGTTFEHPEFGIMTVQDLIAYQAGHDWRHVGHLRQIAG
jgi:hypothetical protein